MKKYSKNILMAVLASVSLVACGGGSDPAPVPVIPPSPAVSVPQPNYGQMSATNYDYVGQYIVPQLQATYGDIHVIGHVFIATQAAPQGVDLYGQTLSWAQLYTTYLQGLAVMCNCGINSVPGQNYGAQPTAGFQGWGRVDYNGFDGYIQGGMGMGSSGTSDFNDWFNSGLVQLTARGETTSFIAVINTLIYANYNVYSVYYQNYVTSYYPSYRWPCSNYGGYIGGSVYSNNYGYQPYNQVNAGFVYNGQGGGNSNWSLNLGGFFSF